ncbi:MAG: capsule biosynthesis protein CapD [Desulfatitalea sp. BRH_c12]|nr:MAG: capsule biosynthesis protein CapD [Desulfatitalea sp. BRH_c12]
MHSSDKRQFYTNKRVFVTGACGTIGKELIRQLLEEHQVAELIGVDNNESELFFLEHRFSDFPNARFFLADVRDVDKMTRKMRHMQIVFHTAAFKHVILCERSPYEAVQTNIIGMQNVIRAATDNKADRVIFTSSDKAVNPTNVMGTSKLMGERLVTAANSNNRGGRTLYVSTRFGNVLGSRGSVIPIFREQIKRGGPVTLTNTQMTRFIMSIKEAVRLVIDSAVLARGGEVFITKMPIMKVSDLALVMISHLAESFGHCPDSIDIQVIGVKPGEKMYEELMCSEETRRALELPDYFAVLPAFKSLYANIVYDYPEVVSQTVNTPYHSGNDRCLTKAELADFLIQNDLLHEDPRLCSHPAERIWPRGL